MSAGPNGAGKTNLLEALYFGCTGRSCRTTNEREVVRFGAGAARVVVRALGEDGPHELSVGFEPGQPKRMRADGAPVERLLDVSERPLVSVFLPDRLELIKGAPSLRRAHLDQFVAALWPARAGTRRAYAQSLAQRNALISRIRGGQGSRASLATWDAQLAAHGIALMQDRARAIDDDRGVVRAAGHRARPRPEIPSCATGRGLAPPSPPSSPPSWPSASTAISSAASPATDPTATTSRSRARAASFAPTDPRASSGSHCWLCCWPSARRSPLMPGSRIPVMLLDDVMSELDRDRREALVEVLRAGGQAVITTTDLEHVPGVADLDSHEPGGRGRQRP